MDVAKLVGQYQPTIQVLKTTIQAVAKARVDSLFAVADKCDSSLSSTVNDIAEMISAVGNWMQFDVLKQAEANLFFTEQIRQLLVEDIPESTELDLRYAGQREAGDEIYLRAALENQTEGLSAAAKSTEVEQRVVTMFQVDVHAKLAAGVMFLSPFAKSKVSFTKQFQAAPSYNFVAKWGSRSSYIRNTFWSIGLGVSISAPDFNLDGTPEIAYGAVLSTASDYLQIGIGRNFGVEAWYWFFGLQLPVGTVINPTMTFSTQK